MNVQSIAYILKQYISTSKNIEVTIQGWIRTRRSSKAKISFLDVYDGSSIHSLQVIAHENLYNYNNEILRLTSGCSVSITGNIINSIGTKQRIELVAKNIKILGWVENPNSYPISTKKHTMEYLRNFAHLRARTKTISSITRIRHTLLQVIHKFMHKQGFIWIPTPIITSSDTEGNSKMFCVSTNTQQKQSDCVNKITHYDAQKFFGKEAFLTVSGQLNAEAYACALSKVYTFGPTFRAEDSNTNRHLAEFWMIEPEVAFANLDDIIILAEHLLKYTIQTVLEKHSDELEFFVKHIDKNIILRLENFVNTKKFICIDYTDAIQLLKVCNKKFNHPIYWGGDLFVEHEKYLSEEYFNSPIIIKNHPKNVKAFYMRLNDDNKTVASMDILIPGIGEIIGGSQREERLNILDQKLQENNLLLENYWWYRDLRRFGTVPHSGFGLGFERLITYSTGLKNIRDVVPFPRTPKNINF